MGSSSKIWKLACNIEITTQCYTHKANFQYIIILLHHLTIVSVDFKLVTIYPA